MSFFNDAQKDALLTGRYICSKCGARMQFEDEWEDILVCLECTLIFENTLTPVLELVRTASTPPLLSVKLCGR